MHTPTAAAIAVLFVGRTALAAEPMAPNDIKATFFNGEPLHRLHTQRRYPIQNDLYAGWEDDP